jgi:hypothetical protein
MFGATAAKTRLFHLHGRYACSAIPAAEFMGSRSVATIVCGRAERRVNPDRWFWSRQVLA